MILEYTCENYKSIKEKIIFSMIASKDNSFSELLIPYEGLQINRVASIYGANGSGKTNVMDSLSFLAFLICNSNNFQPGDKIRQPYHKLCGSRVPTSFSIQFIKNGIRYAYGLSYTAEQVISEYLYYFPNGKQAKIFDRNQDTITFGEKFKKDFEAILNFSKPNKLFLSVSANYSAVNEAEIVFLFFKEDIIFYPQPVFNNWFEYSIEKLTNDANLKRLFVEFMNSTGNTIKNINTKYEKSKITPDILPINMPDTLKKLFIQGEDATKIEAQIDYGLFNINLEEESKGIQKLFEVFCSLMDIIFMDKVLVWDEIETSLHPQIVNEILRLILHGKADSKAQLIFSTHDTNLLDLTKFRRDQIWFTELNSSRATDLYSLAELKNVRKDENISKGYLSGKYGAIPFIHNPLKFPAEEDG